MSDRRQLEFQHVEVLRSAPDMELPARLALLGNSIEQLMTSGTINEVALERVFAQQNLPSVMGVAQLSGIVMFLAERAGIPVTLYTPNEVKSRVTGYGAADKAQVTNMVMKQLGLTTPPKPADAADALAIAITHARSMGFARASQTGRSVGRSATPAQEAWRRAEQATKRGRRA